MARRRVSFATIAVTGLGAFVAAAIGVTLYVSAASGLRSTQALLAQQAEALLDALEARLEARLRPVRDQADGIVDAVGDGRLDLTRAAELDAFMAGALGATPQVSELAIVDAGGRARRWNRGEPTASLLREVPLYRHGAPFGTLGQVVAIAKLSEELAVFGAEHDVTPFVLDGADRVLAHPLLAQRREPGARPGLPDLARLGDPVLERLRSPDGASPLLRAVKRGSAVRARVGERHIVYVTRELPPPREGRPWTIGVYLDPVRGGQRAEMLLLARSIAAGLAVLVLAVALAALAGRRVGRPIEALARAARAVRKGQLDQVQALPRSRLYELDEANRSFGEMLEGLRERDLIRDTLGQYVPEQVAHELLAGGGRLEPIEAKATVLVCDIEGFATLTDTLGAHRTIEFLNAYFEVVVAIVERYRGVVTQFQGDAILAVFNVPIADQDHGANALRAALEMVHAADAQAFAEVQTRNRVGLATGRVVAGAVGSAGRLNYTVHGNAVNLAARLEQLNKDYGTRILLSGKTAERCPGFALRKVADAAIRGYGEPVEMYTVSASPASGPPAAP